MTHSNYYVEQSHYEAEFATKRQLYKRFADDLLNFAAMAAVRMGLPFESCRLLDVGAGRGWLVERARTRGISAVGVELNRANVHAARSDGIPLYESMGEIPSNGSQQPFDIVVFSAVIEHVREPVPFLTEYLSRLRSGGLVVISQAAFDGLLPAWAPWLWYGWQPREHYWHFDESALVQLLCRVGLSDVLISRTSLHHPSRWCLSPKELVGRNLAWALARLGSRFARGDQLYVAGIWTGPTIREVGPPTVAASG